jgi:signal transduction histidine kinase
MFTGIVHDLTGRRQLEQEVLHASTDEQRRIGQDLHDGLCQELVSLSMGAELVAKRLDSTSPPDANAVRKLSDDVQSAAEQARRLSHGLNPVDVEAGGLAGALEHLARRVTESTSIQCRLTHHPLPPLTEDVTTNLYRIAQEAVGNAVKHARASRIEIRLRAGGDGAVTLEVTDDGRGIGPDVTASRGGPRPRGGGGGGPGIGVRTMTYRARVIGGDLTIARRRGGGTVVTCSVRRPGP